ncbi:adenosylmethionine decarboxylase SPE2 [Sugiyamaella lignohabitans]|uniref:adenosylmethionine decarboxylase n=1 Tax=Sugiyamaella lignohabitans TaxID=796027 RepID=A0A167F4Z8_9ASCO|nr:adenosylmethionine decarboxylase SPE2 [Sugiyamaella lignohabitans]ANB14835.1 adenosylmethionine decarboxylase SPE2 [Sugiyamaella lignohabitans]
MIVDPVNHTSKFVNHDVSVNLDSTDAFEGPEKLLEIWFAPDEHCLPYGMPESGLREIPRQVWEQVLDVVQCKVLSVVSSSKMDAFVLSESSLFVFANKLILKTCGTTTLLVGLGPLLDAVSEYCGFPKDKQPWRVFYSRRSFMFPDRQKHPHKSWKDEVACLDNKFANGSSYVIGDVQKDHWYLYLAGPSDDCTFPRRTVPGSTLGASGSVSNGTSITNGHNLSADAPFDDETLEILMTDLNPVHANQFCSDRIPGVESNNMSSVGAPADDEDPGHDQGNIVTKLTGIDQIYPTLKQTVDSFCFTPCGYSCNGVVNQGNYFTIHVTPEQGFSYASFETNVPAAKYGMSNADVIEKVVNIFRPGRFSTTFMRNRNEDDESDPDSAFSFRCLPSKLNGYQRTERILYELGDYSLVFITFEANRALK